MSTSNTSPLRDESQLSKLLDAHYKVVNDYINDYELDDGEHCPYVPNEGERALLTDAVNGLLADREFLDTLFAWQAEVRSLRSQAPDKDGMVDADPNCRKCRGTGVEEESGNGEGGGGVALYDCTCRFRKAYASPPSQPIASDVVAAPEPVAWFQNDAAEGQPPHYSQIAAEYVGTEGTFPLFRGSRRSSVEDESHQSPRDTQRLLEALKSLTEKGYTQASGLSWNKRLKAARDLIKEFEQ